MANLFQPSLAQITDDDGNPVSGGKRYFYLTETTTLATVYADQAGTTPLANPVVADSNGRTASVYLDAESTYRYRETDAGDTPLRDDVDPVRGYDAGMVQDAAESAIAAAEAASEDAEATAADRVATGADRAAASASATSASGSATAAASSATSAATSASDAEDAVADATAAIGVLNVYSNTTLAAAKTAGLAAVGEGVRFAATGDDVDYIGIYEDNSGVAVEKTRIAKSSALDAIPDTIYSQGKPDGVTGGSNGDFYVDQTNGVKYGPKASGVWPDRGRYEGQPFPLEPVTVVFMMGQSNADGWSTDPNNTTALTNGRGYEYYWDRKGRGVVLPLGKNRLGRTQGGPQCAFAQTWAGAGGGAVVFVDCAVGGSSMASTYKAALTGTGTIANLSGGTWDLSDPANLYEAQGIREHMQFALSELYRLGFDVRKKAVYWSQGEQDRLGNISVQSLYEDAFEAFALQVREDFPGTYWLIERMGDHRDGSNDAASAVVRAAQSAVAAANSSWMTVACDLAKDFTSGNYSDSLHYNQAAYNSLGAEMATNGVTFCAATGIGVPGSTKYGEILANPMRPDGWYRMRLTTSRNGAWTITGLFNDPTTPYACTFYDGSGANGVDAAQAPAWTFGDASEKHIYLYAHESTGGSLGLTLAATSEISDIYTIDQGFPLDSLNAAGGIIAASTLTDDAFYRVAGTGMSTLITSLSSGISGAVLTNAMFSRLSGLTFLAIDRHPGVVDIDLTDMPNITRFDQQRSGLSVAQVNQILIDLDANGKTGGLCQISQFLSGTYAASPPSGAGATAKTSLQGKGWTVNTD